MTDEESLAERLPPIIQVGKTKLSHSDLVCDLSTPESTEESLELLNLVNQVVMTRGRKGALHLGGGRFSEKAFDRSKANPKCKKCLGIGRIGKTLAGAPIICTKCAERMMTDEAKKEMSLDSYKVTVTKDR